MLIFRKGHSHIKQDDLSAYLDGQISEADAARIDQRLAQCADCRQELDALRSTVSLLQQMPELTLPRSFIMPGPPPAPIAIRPLLLYVCPSGFTPARQRWRHWSWPT